MESDIRDIKGLVDVPYPWWVWALLAFVVVAIGLIVWAISRKKAAVIGETPVPLPTPYVIALAALERLRRENLPVEEFYTRVADIVRQFIEGQFGLRAPERTTEEFLSEAKLPAASMELLGAFLQEADLVKFARHRPGTEDMDRALGAAEKFVRESAR
ncbi:MAG: hypothetical protein PCFJNLEI_01082 [Verrucomicrobiae bacterium]|nr:hypothetical protein [Verrucomicrobiae bacterium]